MLKPYVRMKQEAISLLVRHSSNDDAFEFGFLTIVLGNADLHAKDVMKRPFFLLKANECFPTQTDKATRIEILKRCVNGKENIIGQKGRHRAFRNTFDIQNFEPLTCVKRDQVGPLGQDIGSYTSEPKEVDQIVTRGGRKLTREM